MKERKKRERGIETEREKERLVREREIASDRECERTWEKY